MCEMPAHLDECCIEVGEKRDTRRRKRCARRGEAVAHEPGNDRDPESGHCGESGHEQPGKFTEISYAGEDIDEQHADVAPFGDPVAETCNTS